MPVATFNTFSAIPGGKSKGGMLIAIGLFLALLVMAYFYFQKREREDEIEEFSKRIEN